ncbi:carbonic anhydrase 7 [Lampris incognitus]|uniref:carbonic anhydrase 7 n=1 Tax=Lampris incognitus TaxID=2546036 RepID=UPI0024B5DF86|nr:carbonic anhydrase 7 [Lampris incognitus]
MTGNPWGYGGENGPSEWHKDFPIAKGDRQSPIDIVPHEASYDASLPPFLLCYDHCTSISISNNGHSVVVEFDDSDDRSVIRGGPLKQAYRLKQIHFHWGGKSCHGSEHTVAGKCYASELHLVHWNAAQYKTLGEAATAPDGLAVLGIFLETGNDHRWLHSITDALHRVKFKGSAVDFKGFNPKCLLPSCLHYWTYPGSLTTPPLHESVIWIVLKEPIMVSEKQMGKFRTLLFSGEEEGQRAHMENNFRPPQPLKGRKVQASFNYQQVAWSHACPTQGVHHTPI